MTAPVPITWTDCTPAQLHSLAISCKSCSMARRLTAIAVILQGASRSAAAKALGVTVRSVGNWVARYNAGGPDGLADRPRAGCPPGLGAAERARLAMWVEASPDPEVDGVCRWRVVDLRNKLEADFGISVSPETLRATLHSMGFSHVSPRPLHPKADPAQQEEFRSNFSALALEAVSGKAAPEDVEIRVQDKCRAGQKGMLSRGWARKGRRPRILRDHRYGYAYPFAAARPENPVAVGHICRRANTREMNRHPRDISAAVAPGRHAVVILDGAGWHRSKDLEIPDNVTLLRLPPYSPELNPAENLFAFLKSNYLANRVFATVDDVYTAIADAWNALLSDPDRISSITTREWAKCAATSKTHAMPAPEKT